MSNQLKYKLTDSTKLPRIRQLQHRTIFEDPHQKIRKCEIGVSQKKVPEKVILVVGKTGEGKTTMINKLINYLCGVLWKDDYRYQISVDDEETKTGDAQIESQTKWVTAYKFIYTKTFPIPYDITIIDSPGFSDTDGVHRDKEITQQIGSFFSQKSTIISHIDAVAFVVKANETRLTEMQKQVFRSVLNLFGKDIKDNIYLFATHADITDDNISPPVVAAAKAAKVPIKEHFSFNNGGMYNEKTGRKIMINKMIWEEGNENIDRFISFLGCSIARDITQSSEVIAERNQLETYLDGIPAIISTHLVALSNHQIEMEMIKQLDNDMSLTKDFTYYINVEHIITEELGHKVKALVCNDCRRTCHNPCDHNFVMMCSAMRSIALFRGCSVCDNHCGIGAHSKTNYQFSRKTEKVPKTKQDLKQKYETFAGQRLKRVDVLKAATEKYEKAKKDLDDQLQSVNKSLKRLNEIALQSNTKTLKEYLQDLIKREAEHSSKNPDWRKRMDMLEKLIVQSHYEHFTL